MYCSPNRSNIFLYNSANLAYMSRDPAAGLVVADPEPSDDQTELRSLNEGIALLSRLEQVLADMQLSLDSLTVAAR